MRLQSDENCIQLREGQEETIVANVWEAKSLCLAAAQHRAIVGDETGNVA